MEKEEIWKDIPRYLGYYQASNLGRIKSIERNGTKKGGRILKPVLAKNGYLVMTLRAAGTKRVEKVHRLIAETFLLNSNNLPQVNHKDENKQNNCVDNLEWCDSKYNINYGNRNKKTSTALKSYIKNNPKSRYKLSEQQALEIIELRKNNIKMREIAKQVNSTYGAVYNVIHKKTWWWLNE